MTGLDIEKDRIIEVGAAVFDMGDVYDKFESLIDPQCPIPEDSIKIHHITNEMIQGKPLIQDVLPTLLHLIGEHIIVGHGVASDIALLINAAKRSSLVCKLEKNPFIDTLRMARLYGESPRNSLETLRAHFNIPLEGAHRAMNDVLVNMEVFRRLAKRYETLEQLNNVLAKPILLKTMPLGKHKGRLFRDIPDHDLRYLSNKNFDQDLQYSIRTELKRRKRGGLFQQEGNPFRGL